MSNITEARKVLVARILEGEGRAPHAQRKAAFDNVSISEPVRTLIEKVVRSARTVTDQDVEAARAAGLTEDQIFELIVCGAVGQAVRQYEAALAALEAAAKE